GPSRPASTASRPGRSRAGTSSGSSSRSHSSSRFLPSSIAAVKTVLFVGAGRHQRRAIARVRELGARVVAADRNPEAPGLADTDVAEVVDFADVEALAEVGRRHGVAGVLTVASDRAVPIVAAAAELL